MRRSAAVRTLQQGLKRRNGDVVTAPFSNGDISNSAPTFPLLFGAGQMRNVVLNDAAWKPETFDLEAMLPVITSVIDERYQFSASRDDLVQYLKAGRKVIVWHGADDGMLSPYDTLRGWNEVTDAAGAAVAAANSRLYIAPGVNHCAGGSGADSIDMLGALMNWVEAGRAPGTLLATKRDTATGKTLLTRPLCRYPAWPRYSGKGDPADACEFRLHHAMIGPDSQLLADTDANARYVRNCLLIQATSRGRAAGLGIDQILHIRREPCHAGRLANRHSFIGALSLHPASA